MDQQPEITPPKQLPTNITADQVYPPPSYPRLYELIPLCSEHSIRLLDLHGPNSSVALSGTMRVVDLRHCPDFTALSYVWGTGRTHSLSCNGCSIPITRNCFDALTSLKSIYGASTIWIDAVCINQEDQDEKARQVQLMAEIYSWSKAVYIWLGEADEGSVKAMKFLSAGSTLQYPMIGAPWVVEDSVRSVFRDRVSLFGALTWFILKQIIYSNTFEDQPCFRWFWPMPPAIINPCTAEDIKRLLNHEWIQRAWTFQELVLASNPVIVCGTHTVSWLSLERILTRVRNSDQFKGILPYDPCRQIIESLESDTVDAWLALINIWTTIIRPCKWHNRTFRRISYREHESECSIAKYRGTYLNTCLIRSASKLSALLLMYFTLGIPSFILLLLIVLLTRYLIPEWAHLVCGLLSFPLLTAPGLIMGKCDWGPRAPAPVIGISDDVSLLGILQSIRDRKASEPRDKAFAIYAVLDRLGVEHAPVDYNQPVGKVYQDLFIALLRWNGSLLNLLLDVGPKLDGAPSWVPDWRTLGERPWVKTDIVYAPILKPKRQIPAFEIYENKLMVRVSILGKVINTSSSFPRINAADTNSANFHASLSLAVSKFSGWLAEISQDTPLGEVYRSLTNSTLDQVLTISAQEDLVFPDWRRLLSRHNSATESQDSILEAMDKDPRLLHFTIKLCNMLAGQRSLFISTNQYTGSGPPEMVVGDTIVLLDSVNMPLILREISDGASIYSVIGAAFVCGYENLLARMDKWDPIILI